MQITALTFALLGAADASMVLFESCPKPSPVDNLNTSMLEGRWYEAQRERLFPFALFAKCMTQEYKKTGDNAWNYNYRAWYPISMEPVALFGYGSVNGELKDCGSNGDDNSCKLTMPKFNVEDASVNIIAQGNDWFAQHSCFEPIEGLGFSHYVFIYSKEKKMSSASVTDAHDAIKAKLPNYDLSVLNMFDDVNSDDNCDDWGTWSETQ
jgi:hypothetical protein